MNQPFEIILVQPRGFCAGVDRAVEIVDLALEAYGAPVYVRREIVHNQAVVQRLRERGVVFVEEVAEVPPGSTCVFSAHGVAPTVFEEARERGVEFIDATCPLVTKVHLEVKRSVREGKTIILIGHAGHDEVLGTMGQAPQRVRLVQTAEDVALLQVDDEEQLYYVTQTTLSVDETQEIVRTLRERFPRIEGPARADICYATQNRQDAVKELVAEGMDLLLVVGSQNSSNSRRLVEVAREQGVEGHLLDSAEDLDLSWLAGRSRIGLTAGASAPEDLVQGLASRLIDAGGVLLDHVVTTEDVSFALPPQLKNVKAGDHD
jgi:4-hydroxy-3-methylbut-2-en-1-yl diphosphate reductase